MTRCLDSRCRNSCWPTRSDISSVCFTLIENDLFFILMCVIFPSGFDLKKNRFVRLLFCDSISNYTRSNSKSDSVFWVLTSLFLSDDSISMALHPGIATWGDVVHHLVIGVAFGIGDLESKKISQIERHSINHEAIKIKKRHRNNYITDTHAILL